MRTDLTATPQTSSSDRAPRGRKPLNTRQIAVGGGVFIVLAALALWLNFGRGSATPPADALEAARAAAQELNQPEPEPAPGAPPAPAPVPSPARPTPLDGR